MPSGKRCNGNPHCLPHFFLQNWRNMKVYILRIMGKKQELEITRTFLSFHNSPSLFTVTWIFDAIKINPHSISKKLVFFPLKQAHLACVTPGQHLHQKPTQKSLRTPCPVVLPKQHLCALLSAFFSALLSLCDQPTNHIILRQTLSKQCERLARGNRQYWNSC